MTRSDPPDRRECFVSDEEVMALETLIAESDLVGGHAWRNARNSILQDQGRVNEIVRLGIAGKSFPDLLGELAEYGFAVMMAWMRTGTIFVRCSAIGRPVRQVNRTLDLTPEARRTISNATVSSAIQLFAKNAVIAGKWQPEQGASLKTFFIGACILTFTNEFNRWANEQRRWANQHYLAPNPEADETYRPGRAVGSFDPTAEEIINTEAEHALLLNIKDQQTRTLAYRIGRGETFSEAGAAVGLSEGAARNRIRRLRHKPQFNTQPWNSEQ